MCMFVSSVISFISNLKLIDRKPFLVYLPTSIWSLGPVNEFQKASVIVIQEYLSKVFLLLAVSYVMWSDAMQKGIVFTYALVLVKMPKL